MTNETREKLAEIEDALGDALKAKTNSIMASNVSKALGILRQYTWAEDKGEPEAHTVPKHHTP